MTHPKVQKWAAGELNDQGIDVGPTEIGDVWIVSEGDTLVVQTTLRGETHTFRRWQGGIPLIGLEVFLEEIGLL